MMCQWRLVKTALYSSASVNIRHETGRYSVMCVMVTARMSIKTG